MVDTLAFAIPIIMQMCFFFIAGRMLYGAWAWEWKKTWYVTSRLLKRTYKMPPEKPSLGKRVVHLFPKRKTISLSKEQIEETRARAVLAYAADHHVVE